MKKKFVVLWALCLLAEMAAAEGFIKAKVWLGERSTGELAKLGVDLTEGDLRPNVWFVGDFSKGTFERITDAGFTTTVLATDAEYYYRNRAGMTQAAVGFANDACHAMCDYEVPQHFSMGSMAGFLTYDELWTLIDSMQVWYPGLATGRAAIDSTLLTAEGRYVYFIKLSDNVGVDENEPELLYTALHHAREPQSMMQLVFYMCYLLERYGTDQEVTNLLDNNELFFIPCLNPDGYVYNEVSNPAGGGLWRKNRRANADGSVGVDLNRNYDVNWGYDDVGSSPFGGDDTYRGTHSFSEPETEAVFNFVSAHQFVLTFNYHSYSNLLIHPYGHQPMAYTNDSTLYRNLAYLLTRCNRYKAGTAPETVNYVANGGSDDWYYGDSLSKPKVFAFTPEVGTADDGFWPAPQRIVPLCIENVYSNLSLARLTGSYVLAQHKQPRYVTGATTYCRFDFKNYGFNNLGGCTISINPLSGNIQSVGTAKVYSGLPQLLTFNDSIILNLSSSITTGSAIDYVLVVDNGYFTLTDTIQQVYGTPTLVLYEDGGSVTAWNGAGGLWGVDVGTYSSLPSSIGDSPQNVYQPNSITSLTLNTPMDLTTAADATLTFDAQWDIEKGYDYAVLYASIDNGVQWTPLCTEYTRAGNNFQLLGAPIFDGNSQGFRPNRASLNNFLGNEVLLKFELVSDGFQEGDGINFDELRVEIVDTINTALAVTGDVPFSLFPNPADEVLTILNPKQALLNIKIWNMQGKVVYEAGLTGSKKSIATDRFTSGLYTVSVNNRSYRLMIVH